MNRTIIAVLVAAPLGLAGCKNIITADVTTAISVARTLATVAAQYNTTAKALVARGNLICGQVNSQTGQLIEASVVAVATMAGAPASVKDAAAATVAAACPVGTVPGPMPATVVVGTVPVVATGGAAALPVAVPGV